LINTGGALSRPSAAGSGPNGERRGASYYEAMARYLFEEPWPAVVVLACAAFGLLLAAMRRRQRAFSVAAAVCVALAVGVYVVSVLVTTDREVVERRTRQLVAATAPIEPATLRAMIDPSAAVMLPNGVVLPMSLALSDELIHAVDRHAIHGQSIGGLHVEMTGDDAAVARLRVRSTMNGRAYDAVHTEWRLTWRHQPDGAWRIVAVEWLKFQNQEPTVALWR